MLVSAGENDQSINPNGENNTVKLWDLRGVEKATFKEHKKPVTSVDFSADGNTIASGSADNIIGLWSVQVSSVVTTLQTTNKDATVLNLDFSPDGYRLAAIRNIDHGIELWNLKTDTHEPMVSEGNSFTNVALSDDGVLFTADKKNKCGRRVEFARRKIDTIKKQQPGVSLLTAKPEGNHVLIKTVNFRKYVTFDAADCYGK